MAQESIKVIFGTAGGFFTDETAPEIYSVLEQHGIKKLDTAQLYAGKEAAIGRTGGANKFVVDTKDIGGFRPGTANKETVIARGEESMKILGTDKVDIYYIHAPERNVPLEDQLAGINELHKRGRFARFGLSNYKPDEVEEVVKVCKTKGFVPPTAYQGNYSPVARRQDTELLPVLRKHGISFYAYSPLAGGFLTKTKEEILAKNTGRFTEQAVGGLYLELYGKPSLIEGLATWNEIATSHGIGKAELAYRWVAYNSPLSNEHGDAIIIGASRMEQLEESLAWFEKGPLPESAVLGIDQFWDSVKNEAGLDNFNR